jgi:hypothetical protein
MSTSKFIALLNHDASIIEAVYPDQTAVLAPLGLKSKGAISTAIKNGTKCQGRRIRMWDDLDEELKDAFLQAHDLPAPKVSNKAKGVTRFNKEDRSIIKSYARITDAVKDTGIARETIASACDKGAELRDSLWTWS